MTLSVNSIPKASALSQFQYLMDGLLTFLVLGILTYRRVGALPGSYVTMGLIETLLVLLVYNGLSVVRNRRIEDWFAEIRTLFRAWSIVFISLIVLGFLTKSSSDFSREVLGFWFVFGYVAQVLFHRFFWAGLHVMRSRGWNQKKALLVGSGGPLVSFESLLRNRRDLGILPSGVLLCDLAGTLPEDLTQRMVLLTSLPEAKEFVRTQEITHLYIVVPVEQGTLIGMMAREFMPLHVEVNWIPDLGDLQLIQHKVRDLDGQPVLCLSGTPFEGGNWAVKWLEDKVLGIALLIVTAPLMLLIAFAIKASSPGPVFYRQRRGGAGGRMIDVWKFRTMEIHRESPGALTQATPDDPRLTPFGKLLRRTSFDELPQLFNVVGGSMSLVGPRPHAIEHDGYYKSEIESYMLRYRIKPGMTGWAQVNGWRGRTETIEKMKTRVQYDLYYINNWSLWFDFKILMLTVVHLLKRENAC
jgi:putative colanic acid biosynthesis UDP-glucose lipid carrier transferase